MLRKTFLLYFWGLLVGTYHFKICKDLSESEDLGAHELPDDEAAFIFGRALLKQFILERPHKYAGYAAHIFEDIRPVRAVGRVTFDLKTGEHY